jgi:hypothetical protein
MRRAHFRKTISISGAAPPRDYPTSSQSGGGVIYL